MLILCESRSLCAKWKFNHFIHAVLVLNALNYAQCNHKFKANASHFLKELFKNSFTPFNFIVTLTAVLFIHKAVRVRVCLRASVNVIKIINVELSIRCVQCGSDTVISSSSLLSIHGWIRAAHFKWTTWMTTTTTTQIRRN